jgi:hypothetical protein
MRKLSPGCNEFGWTGQVQCTENLRTREVGCGALLEITKDDLYTVAVSDIKGSRIEVRFRCLCLAENLMPSGKLFKELPKREEWLKSHNSG